MARRTTEGPGAQAAGVDDKVCRASGHRGGGVADAGELGAPVELPAQFLHQPGTSSTFQSATHHVTGTVRRKRAALRE